ncbi:response regulator, partial [Myxococcota bacterium]
VDDAEDIHDVTKLALRRRTWRKRKFNLVSTYSGKEARELLASQDSPSFQVALVDVVMETDQAGLELCEHIRATFPRSIRLILRTGQPGVAPEEKVLNDYDIDYYLAKSEVTEERLFTALRACIRSSLDIATLLAVGKQLQGFAEVLQSSGSSVEGLLTVMSGGISVLEEKHDARITFFADLDKKQAIGSKPQAEGDQDFDRMAECLQNVHSKTLEQRQMHEVTEEGFGRADYVIPVTFKEAETVEQGSSKSGGLWTKLRGLLASDVGRNPLLWDPKAISGGVLVKFLMEPDEVTKRLKEEFLYDVGLFLENWRIAYTMLRLQEEIGRERALQEKAMATSSPHGGTMPGM